MSNDDLIELEQRFWRAAGDAGFYDEHMSDDGLCLLPVGTLDKRATREAIAGAPPWTSFELRDVVVLAHGEVAATLCYRASARRGEVAYEALVSTTYRRHAGRWELVVHQQTPLAPLPGNG